MSLQATPETARDYARERAAELVGKRVLQDGTLADNPNPQFAITETLRADIRAKVAKAIEEGWSPQRLAAELTEKTLSPSRAFTIARTETGFAYQEGTIKVFEKAGQDLGEVLDGDGCLPGGHNAAAVRSPANPGVVYDAMLADGQIWTIAQMRAHRLGHPNCVRDFVPYVG